jgi:hypothetical protein
MAEVIYELRVGVIAAQQYALNVFHYYVTNPSIADDFVMASDLRQSLDDGGAPTSWIYKFQQMLATDAFVSSVSARQIWPTGGNASPQAMEPTDFPGAFPSETSALQLAGRINWFSEEAPNKVGGNFIPGVSVAAITASRWEADYKTAADNFIAKHITGHTLPGGTALPCIWDRTNEQFYRIIDGYLSVKPGSMRRREKPI